MNPPNPNPDYLNNFSRSVQNNLTQPNPVYQTKSDFEIISDDYTDPVCKNIMEWDELYDKYSNLETICINSINAIGEIKNTLKKLLGNQKKDDLVFYKAIIDNTHFYLSSSLKIRKMKFLKDLNFLWSQIDERKQMDEVNKSNFTALLKDYKKMAEDIAQAKKNNTILTWVKDDKIENLHELENDFNEIMKYHTKLIDFFSSSVELERIFYCGK